MRLLFSCHQKVWAICWRNFCMSSGPAHTCFPACVSVLWSSCILWFGVSETIKAPVMVSRSCQLDYPRNHLKLSLSLACSSVLSVKLSLNPTSLGLHQDQQCYRNLPSPIFGDWTTTRFSSFLSWYSHCWTSQTMSCKLQSNKSHIWNFFLCSL